MLLRRLHKLQKRGVSVNPVTDRCTGSGALLGESVAGHERLVVMRGGGDKFLVSSLVCLFPLVYLLLAVSCCLISEPDLFQIFMSVLDGGCVCL